jgi:hypothetical protein
MSPQQIASAERRPGVTRRALLLGVVFIGVNAFWLMLVEQVLYQWVPTVVAPLGSAVFILLLLAAGNQAIRRRRPRLALTPGELATVFVMVSVGGMFMGRYVLQLYIGLIALPQYMGKQAPVYDWLYGQGLLPEWLAVKDEAAVHALTTGHSSIYDLELLRPWLGPLAWGALYLGAACWVMLCLAALFRKRWVEEERLSFPIVQLPLALTDPEARLLRDRLMWAGFSLPMGITLINCLHVAFPAIPQFVTGLDLGPLVGGSPWSWLVPGWVGFSPFQLGIAFLIPLNLSFSMWVLHLYWCGQMMVSGAMGNPSNIWVAEPAQEYQASGGYFGIIALILWGNRRLLLQRLRIAFGLAPAPRQEEEPLGARVAVFGAIIGFGFLLWFASRLGMSLWLATVFFAAIFALSLLVARLRAQLGLPMHHLIYGPQQILTGAVGARNFSARDLCAIYSLFWINHSYQMNELPYQMEGLKLGEQTRSTRGLGAAISIALVAGSLFTLWAILDQYYRVGALNVQGHNNFKWAWPVQHLTSWVNSPSAPDPGRLIAMGAGFAAVVVLGVLDLRFPGWPLHPMAYPVAAGHFLRPFFISVFLAWLLKTLVLRYGGARAYRRAMPFFLGMILGDICASALAGFVSLSSGINLSSGLFGTGMTTGGG